jgi:hypothetical protein
MAHAALNIANADDRNIDRAVVAIAAGLRSPSGRRVPVMVRNLSADGFMCEGGGPLAPGCAILLDLFDGRSFGARVVWKRNGHIGAAFETPLSPSLLATIV